MRIIFFGTPEFAVPSLEAAVASPVGDVVAVVTQPDRPRGRSRSKLIPPPVKVRALSFGIPVLQPERPSDPGFLEAVRALAPDLGVVVAYGHVLKPTLLSVPRHGMINVHASLLPAWRGAAPIVAARVHGDRVTGVTVMQMEKGLDSGPVLLTRETEVADDETGGMLTTRLAALGAEALTEALDQIADGTAHHSTQDSTRATYAPKVNHDTARIDWNVSAERVVNHILAFDPIPGAWTTLGADEIKLFSPELAPGSGLPGSVLQAGPDLVVAAGAGAVLLREVQPAGKSRMSASDWLRGRSIAAGTRLG